MDDDRSIVDPRVRHLLRIFSPERGEALADLIQALRDRRRERAVVMVRRAADAANLDAASLLAHFLETERRLAFLEEAVRQVEVTHSEEKRLALARVLSMGGGDDATLDYPELLLAMLDRLEAPHVKVLSLIGEPRPGTGQLEGHQVSGGVAAEELSDLAPGLAEAVDLIVANLESRGLIRNTAAGTWDGIEGNALWNVTSAGEKLLKLLANREIEAGSKSL